MYCPKCGKENAESQKFCRSCGLGLQIISNALTTEQSTHESHDLPVPAVPEDRTKWQNPLLYGLLLLVLGMVVIVVGKRIIGEQLVADLGVLVGMLGIGLFGLKGVLLIVNDPKSVPQSKSLSDRKPTPKLSSDSNLEGARGLLIEPPISVTEQTTRSLEPVIQKRKAE